MQQDPIKLEADLYCAGYPSYFDKDVDYASDGEDEQTNIFKI